MNNTIYAHRWDYALQIEKSITAELVKQIHHSPNCLLPILQQFLDLQNQICLYIEQAQQLPKESLPIGDLRITPDEGKWQNLISEYASNIQDSAQQYPQLWLTKTAFESTSIFYRQFATNTLDPTARLFLSSLSEVKKVAARRAESALRICINNTWQELGFCPFTLN